MKILFGSLFFLQSLFLFSQRSSIHHFEYLFDLHGQSRVIELDYELLDDTVLVKWKLRRDSGCYLLLTKEINDATGMSFQRGVVEDTVKLKAGHTLFQMISVQALIQLLEEGHFVYNETIYEKVKDEVFVIGEQSFPVIHVRAQIDETEMWITRDKEWPMVVRLIHNPLGINYKLLNIN